MVLFFYFVQFGKSDTERIRVQGTIFFPKDDLKKSHKRIDATNPTTTVMTDCILLSDETDFS